MALLPSANTSGQLCHMNINYSSSLLLVLCVCVCVYELQSQSPSAFLYHKVQRDK